MTLRTFGVGLLVSYGLGYTVWQLLLWLPAGERWWPLVVSDIFGLLAYAPLPFMALLAVASRRRIGWLCLLAPLVGFGIEYGGLFLPSSATVSAATPTEPLRVMTWNTWHMTEREDAFVRTITTLEPDIVTLQEVGFGFDRNLAALEDEWPYQVHGTVRGRSRVALLSRWPLVDYEVDGRWLGCHCMQAVVMWRGERVRVVNAHVWAPHYELGGGLSPVRYFDTAHQDIVFTRLLEVIGQADEPVVLLGDLNTTPRQANYARLTASGLADAHADGGWGFGLTFPAPNTTVSWLPFSLLRIDHILTGAGWEVEQAATRTLAGSDHQYVWADLVWRGP